MCCTHNIKVGYEGEQLAKQFFIDNGYDILAQNWRWAKVEVDLIVRKGNEIVFVEVKTRNNIYYGEPEVFVGIKKQRLLIAGAHQYMQKCAEDFSCRFDVVAVSYLAGDTLIKHIPYAFSPQW